MKSPKFLAGYALPVFIPGVVLILMTIVCFIAAYVWKLTFPLAWIPLWLWLSSIYTYGIARWAFNTGLFWRSR